MAPFINRFLRPAICPPFIFGIFTSLLNVAIPATSRIPVLTLSVAAIPVKFAPLIAGNAPVKLPAVKFVRFAPLIAGSVPVTCAAGRAVKFAPLPL